MNEAILTFVSPLKSLEDRLSGNTEVCFWEVDSRGILLPGSEFISLEHIIPSKAISAKNYYEQNAIEEDYSRLLSYLTNKFNKKKQSLTKELSKIKNTHTKSYEKKLNQLNSLSLFLDNITSKVYLEKSPVGNNIVYSLHIPFLDSRDFPIGFSAYFQTSQTHKKYNSISQSVKRQIGFPFSKIHLKKQVSEVEKADPKSLHQEDSSETHHSLSSSPISSRIFLKNQKEFFPVDFIASQKGLAIDIETTNYLPLLLPDEFDLFSEQELKQFLEQNEVFSIEELDLMNKKRLLKATKDFLDIKRDERITTISLASPDSKENYLLTTFESDLEKILVKSPLDDAKNKQPGSEFKIIKFDSQEDMIIGAIKKIEEINPLFVYGHNQLKFDYQKLSEFSSEGFNAGINGRSLKYVHSILGQYIVNRILPGRIDIDPALYSQFYMSNKNNRLDSVFEAVTGAFSKKTLTHEELEENTKLAEKGDLGKAQEILYYAAQDVLKSHAICERLKREHILLSRLYSSLPSRIDTTSPKSLTEEYWANKHLANFNNLPSRDIALETIVLKINSDEKTRDTQKTSLGQKTSQNIHSQKAIKFLKFGDFNSIDFFLKEITREHQNIKSKTGLNEGYLIYFSPLLSSFLPLLEKDENIKAIVMEIKDSEPQKKLRLLRSLNYLCEYPYFKFLQSKPSFLKEFGLNETEDIYKNIADSLYFSTDTLVSLISSPEFLNIKGDLILLKANSNSEKLIENLKEAGIGFSLGKYKALSGKKGTMIGTNHSWSFMLGASDPDSKRGEKTPFESDFERELIDSLLNEKDRLKPLQVFAKYSEKIAKDLSKYRNDELVSEPYYQAEKTLKRDSSDFSSHGMSKYKMLAIKNHANEGDLITITNTKEGLYKKLFNCAPYSKEPEVDIANSSKENYNDPKNQQTTKDLITKFKSNEFQSKPKQNSNNQHAKSKKNQDQLCFDFVKPLLTNLGLQIEVENRGINYNPTPGKLTRLLSWAYAVDQSNIKRDSLYKIISGDYLKTPDSDELVPFGLSNDKQRKLSLLDLANIIAEE